MPVVTLYSRPDCQLCDEARAEIRAMRRALPFDLREVDIETEEGLTRAYLERIPVVEVDGEIVSELVFDPRRLQASLDTLLP
jgi:glutaredoxin